MVCFVTLIIRVDQTGKGSTGLLLLHGTRTLQTGGKLAKNHEIYPMRVNVSILCMHRFKIFIILCTIL